MSLDTSPTFRTVRLREGYDVAEVDAFLERAAAAPQQDPPTTHADELRHRNGSGGATETPAQPSVVQRQPSTPWVPLNLVAIAVPVVLVLVR